jgi:hypothetical protein
MKISGYVTSRNCVSLDYSLKECVESLKQFCDEIIIADSTDTKDGTRELLQEIEKSDSRIKVYHQDLDYSAPNHGIFDGQMKAYARSKCTGDWLWQTDLDEIVHEIDAPKIRLLCEQLDPQKEIKLVATPVIEFWGSEDKVRIDVNIWKWRVSRNLPHITHGIPGSLRFMKDGLLYAKPGTDGCDYIDKFTGDPIPFASFVSQQNEALRQLAVKDSRYISHYEQWFNDVVDQFPGVFHFSWYSIERKIQTYKKYWNKHWQSLYGEKLSDNNMFFDVSWDEVTDEMIKAKAKELRENTGGHVFHTKYTGQKTNNVKVYRDIPNVIKEWAKEHADE